MHSTMNFKHNISIYTMSKASQSGQLQVHHPLDACCHKKSLRCNPSIIKILPTQDVRAIGWKLVGEVGSWSAAGFGSSINNKNQWQIFICHKGEFATNLYHLSSINIPTHIYYIEHVANFYVTPAHDLLIMFIHTINFTPCITSCYVPVKQTLVNCVTL